MNKKELAKLLIKHPEIRALYESQEFDMSTINKIIAEEIVREQEDDDDQKGEPEGRVDQSVLDARAEIDAEDSVDLSIDAEESIKKWRQGLKQAADKEGVEKIVQDFTDVYGAIIKSYEKTSSGLFAGKLKAAKREFKSLQRDAKRALSSLEKTKELASQVAQTDDKKDDAAVVKAVVDQEPKVTEPIKATKAAIEKEDPKDIQAGMTAVNAAIAALAKQAQNDAKAANDDLDLSGIEIDDGDAAEPAEEREKVTLDRNKPTLQRLADGFVNLTDEQYAQIAAQLDEEVARLRKKMKRSKKKVHGMICHKDLRTLAAQAQSLCSNQAKITR